MTRDPLRFTDPSGLSPLDCIECYREKEKAHTAIEKCQKELEGCKGNFEKEIEFMEKYKADNYSTAILNCVQLNAPEAYDNALKACAKCGLLGGPKPPRSPRF